MRKARVSFLCVRVNRIARCGGICSELLVGTGCLQTSMWLMQVCEGTDAVAPNARSHSALLSGIFIGDATSLVRLKFGIEASTREVAMHVTVRSDTPEVSELVHQMIQDA